MKCVSQCIGLELTICNMFFARITHFTHTFGKFAVLCNLSWGNSKLGAEVFIVYGIRCEYWPAWPMVGVIWPRGYCKSMKADGK